MKVYRYLTGKDDAGLLPSGDRRAEPRVAALRPANSDIRPEARRSDLRANHFLQLKGRGQGQTLVDGFVVIELFDGTIKFFVDRNLRQVILHLFDAGREVSKIKLLNW